MQLMQSLVESLLLYGAESWGCHQKLDGLYQLQLRALRIFFGVRRCAPPKGVPDDRG